MRVTAVTCANLHPCPFSIFVLVESAHIFAHGCAFSIFVLADSAWLFRTTTALVSRA
jgi:hypothetical protein